MIPVKIFHVFSFKSTSDFFFQFYGIWKLFQGFLFCKKNVKKFLIQLEFSTRYDQFSKSLLSAYYMHVTVPSPRHKGE